MYINIVKLGQKFSFRDSANNEFYYGTYVTRWFRQVKQLYQRNTLIAEIYFRLKWPFKAMYEIVLFAKQRQRIELKYTSLSKPKFVGYLNGDVYEIIPHKGLKTSIIKNGEQIGYYVDKRIEYLGSQTTELVADYDIEQNVIFSFILALECDFENDYSTVSVDLGNFGPEVRNFDDTWLPKTKDV